MFTENRGQIVDMDYHPRPDILFKARRGDVSLFYGKERISYVFTRFPEGYDKFLEQGCTDHGTEHEESCGYDENHPEERPAIELHRMDLEFIGSNANVTVKAEDPLSSTTNYYLPQCPNGLTGVRSYRKLIYQDLYPNIDMVLYATDNGTKCDFVVHPGGNVANIRFRYSAADQVKLMNDGSMKVVTSLGYVHEEAPYTYQGILGNGGERKVSSQFTISDGVISFKVGSYDRSKALVIDPRQLWSTFVGGTVGDQLNGGDPTEVDRQGNVMITGYTSSDNFPNQSGYQTSRRGASDAFVTKFNGIGTLQWSTYFGGSQDDLSHGVATDKVGNVFIAGHTFSSTAQGFPIVNCNLQSTYGGNRDAFVAKFTAGGSIMWSTYYGGTSLDDGYGFAVDSTDSVAVIISSESTGMSYQNPDPRYPRPYQTNRLGPRDALLVKIGKDGYRVWATYLGGSGTDWGYAAATDNSDNIIITGWTNSSDFPRLNAAQNLHGGGFDAYVAKFDRWGNLKWSTYWGSSGNQNDGFSSGTGYSAIATDIHGNVFIAGATTNGFPTANALFPNYLGGTSDAYIAKFSPTGVNLWSTYMGGTGNDIGVGVASNALGGVLLTGFTNGPMPTTLPPREPAFQLTNQGGANDAYIIKLDPDGDLQWGTFFGGPGDDQGHGISFDPYGSIIIAGHTTSTTAFPFAVARNPSEPPFQANNRGNLDAFISVFCDPSPPEIDSSGPTTFCHDQSLTLSIVDGYFNVKWFKMPDVSTPFSTSNSVTLTESGRYFVTVENAGGCPASSDTIDVTKLQRLNPTISGPSALCTGDSIDLNVTGGPYTTHVWKKDGAVIPGANTPRLKVKQGGAYRIVVTDRWGCADSTQQTVTENPKPAAVTVTPADTIEICEGQSTTLSANGGSGGNIEWSNGSGGNSLIVTQQGNYFAKSVNPSTGCFTVSNRVYVKVNPKPQIRIVNLLPIEFCEGDSTVLVGDPNSYAKYVWSTGEETKQITVKKSGTYTLVVTDSKGCSNQAEITVTVSEKPKPKIDQTGPIILCEGDTTVISIGGGSFQSVLWSNGSIGNPLRVTRSGLYYATVGNSGGCKGISDTIEVKVNPKPNVTISGSLEVCTNSSETYSVPSQTGVTYDWQITGAGASIASGGGTNSITINWGPAGNGTVKVTVTDDVTKCKATSTINVKVGSALVPNITGNRSPQLCPGDSIILDAGGGYTSYKWSNNATTRTITVKSAGTYTVEVQNAAGCGGTSKPFQVTVTTGPTPTIVATRTTLCPGDTAYLTTSEQYDDYLWSGGQTIDRIAVWATGSYTVSVVDSNGCRGTSAPIQITVADPPAPVVTGPGSVCINSTHDYSVTNVPGDLYQWNVNGGVPTTGLNGSSITVQWPTAGTFWVEVTQRSGATSCSTTVRYPVTVGTSLEPVITSSKSTAICEGDSVTLDAGAGYASYLWSTNETTRTITARGGGTYSVTVTDAGGCSGTGDITVLEKPPVEPKIVPDGRPGLCFGDSLRLEATEGFVRYLWSTGDTTQSIWVKDAGNYTVTVYDIDSCVGASAAVSVVVFPKLTTPEIIALGDTLLAVIDTIDSPKPMLYEWRLDGELVIGATAQRYVTQVVGSYTVTVVDSNGCTATSEPFTPMSAATATVQLPVLEAEPGERVKVPISLVASENLDRNKAQKFVGELRFDKNLLILIDPRFQSRVDGDEQVVRIEGDRPITMNAGELLTVDFIAALGDKISTPLTFKSFDWTDSQSGVVPVTMLAGSFTLKNLCETGGRRLVNASGNVGIKAVRPNPASSVSEIEYEVNEHGRTQLAIVDLLGRPVAMLVDGDLEPGSYAIQFDASKFASGTYFCVLQTPTIRMHQVMQVEK